MTRITATAPSITLNNLFDSGIYDSSIFDRYANRRRVVGPIRAQIIKHSVTATETVLIARLFDTATFDRAAFATQTRRVARADFSGSPGADSVRAEVFHDG